MVSNNLTRKANVAFYTCLLCYIYMQETRECLPPDHVNEIWEAMKDYGVLVGKGDFYGNVS